MELLHPILDWIRDSLVETGFSESWVRKLEIAIEEALVNIIHHAYKDEPGDIEVLVSSEAGKEVRLTLADCGPPFNPLVHERKEIDPESNLEEMDEGGLGIFFMKKLMDELSYERKGNQNVLTLIKKVH